MPNRSLFGIPVSTSLSALPRAIPGPYLINKFLEELMHNKKVVHDRIVMICNPCDLVNSLETNYILRYHIHTLISLERQTDGSIPYL